MNFNFNWSLIAQRVGLLIITGLAILTSAAACSLPGLNLGGGTPAISLGVLKQDPSVSTDRFGKVNSVKTISGQVEASGLSNLSGLKMSMVSSDNIYLLTSQKGLFRTKDGGRTWERRYVFKPASSNADPKAKDAEIAALVAKNDALVPADFAFEFGNGENIYFAASQNKVGKIFASNDGGENFREIYTEVQSGVEVKLVSVDPKNPLRVYAVLDKGVLIRSLDGGKTWQKMQSFKDQPVQIGFIPEFNNLFYILFTKSGLAVSSNDGETWTTKVLAKEDSKIGEVQPKDSLSATLTDSAVFGNYEKIVPVTSGNNKGWILLADRQMWFSSNVDGKFTKILLPVQSEQYNLLDAAVDPYLGLDKILVAVDNKLFSTNNRGQSWSTDDKLGVSTTVGNIGQIIIDPKGNKATYLMLLNPSLKRGTGNGIFI